VDFLVCPLSVVFFQPFQTGTIMRLHSKLLLTLLASVAFGLPALGAAKDKTKGLPDAAPAAAPVDNKPVQDAKSKLAVAQGKVEHAQDAMNQLIVQLRKDAETSPTISEAVTALKQAQSEYDSATGPILIKVRGTSEYLAAMEEKKAAAAKVLELQAAVPPDQGEITKAATIVLDKGHAITKLEANALAADPKASALKEKLTAANSHLLKARYELDQSIKSNPQIQAAKKTIEDAQVDVPPLQAAYNSALQKYNADVAARDQAVAAANKNSNNHSSDNYTGPGGKMYKKK
jgi:hypothetical protein